MNLKPVGEEIVHRLIHADVCFDTTNKDLLRAKLVELRLEWRHSAGAECGFLNDFD